MTERQEQAKLRKTHKLPYRCQCGGIMEYAYAFGRVFSVCKRCTPFSIVDPSTRMKVSHR